MGIRNEWHKTDKEDKAVLGFSVGCLGLIALVIVAAVGFGVWVIIKLVNWLTSQHIGG